jgi:serine/threonine-protein kinase
LRLTAQVADALAAAAADRAPRPEASTSCWRPTTGKVVDFGIAAHRFGRAPGRTPTALTASGSILGSAPYMSPEQAAGRAVDERSDIFSLGGVLYEMLAGHRPFGATDRADALAAILRDTPPPIPGVGSEVARIIERCLSKDPAKRFQSAAELKAAIEACLAPGPRREGASVAVLPFTNMSGAKEDDYLCDGLAEEIINALTRIPELRVIARTSAFVVGAGATFARQERGSALRPSSKGASKGRTRVWVTAQLVPRATAPTCERALRPRLTDLLVLEDDVAGPSPSGCGAGWVGRWRAAASGRRCRGLRLSRGPPPLRERDAGGPGKSGGVLPAGDRTGAGLRHRVRLDGGAALVPGDVGQRTPARRVLFEHLVRPACA